MLVLPTETVPAQLKQFVTADGPTRKMLNGFRNKINANLKLVLVRNDSFCAQSFCYTLKDEQFLLDKLKTYETAEQKIETLQNNHLLISKAQTRLFDATKDKISGESVNTILGQLGSSQSAQAAKNLLLNAFDSFDEVNCAGLGPILMGGNQEYQVGVSASIGQAYVGKSLLNVPTFNKESGDWGSEHNYKLKVEIVTKVPNTEAKDKESLNEAQIIQDKQ